MIYLPPSRAAEPVGKFTSVEGTVDVLRGGALPAIPVKVGDPVFVKDVIRTKSNSKAEILFTDGNRLIISQRSRIDISEYISDETKSRAIIKLPRGNVEAIVEKKTINRISISPEANRFEIHTPCAVAGARGSRYSASQGDNCALVYVSEGVIYVFNPKFPDKVVVVKAGQVTRVCEDGIPLPARDATEEEKKGFEKLGMMDAPIFNLMDLIITTSPPAPGTNVQPPITELYPNILTPRGTSIPSGCFTPDTKILMGDQTFKEIVNLKLGDVVQSFDFESGKIVPQKVTRLYTTDQDHYYLINGKLKVTATHPFFTSEGKWKKVLELKIGDRIQSDGVGKSIEITSIEKKELAHQVYNFRVAEGHNYFVSPDGIELYLSHNK